MGGEYGSRDCVERVTNIMIKGETADYQHFLFSRCFLQPSPLALLEGEAVLGKGENPKIFFIHANINIRFLVVEF